MADPEKKRKSRVVELLEQKKQEAPKETDAPFQGFDEAFGLDEFGTERLW